MTQPQPPSRTDAVLQALKDLHNDNIIIAQAMQDLVDQLRQNALFPACNVKLNMDSSRLIKPEVSVYGSNIRDCQMQAIATMRDLLAEFPAPPREPKEPKPTKAVALAETRQPGGALVESSR